MKKSLTRKALVLGIIISFLIAGVIPIISCIDNNLEQKYTPIELISFDPFDEGWFYQKQITINHKMVDGDLTNFPILINIVDSDLAAKAQNDGDDILFMDGSGVANILSHEIELFSGGSGELLAWVNVSFVSSSEDTVLYMYYGNPSCNSQENVAGVWDSSFVMVQHLDETSGIHYDSTEYNNDGTCINGVNQNVIGHIDGADGFDGSDDWINCGNDDSFNLVDEMTLEAWVNRTGDGLGRYLGIISCAMDTSTDKYNRYQLRYKPEDDVVNFFIGDDTNYTIVSSDDDLALGVWTHLVATWDGTNMFLFVDSVEQIEVGSFTSSPDTTSAVLEIGRYFNINYFQGLIDEVRVSNIYRDSSWITTEYNNQNDPSNFLTIGTEKGYLEEWKYRKKITINHDMVDGDLTNFPILIKTIDIDLASKAQSDGDDILFMDGSGVANILSHEIELFSGGSGELLAWVNVSFVSSSEDTVLYMYYGNPSCNSQENVAGVWDSSFVMVQHLDETSGIHYDSTFYGNDGTCINGTNQNVVGHIDGADGFDGSDDWINCGNDDSFNLVDEMTLEAWVNRTGDGLGRFLGIISRRGGGYNRYQLRYKPDDNVTQFFLGDGSTYTILSSDDDLSLGVWIHLAASWDGTNMYLFVDGVEQSNVSLFTSSPVTTSAILELGRYTEQNYFEGLIDEIRVSNIYRDSSWITTEYNNQNDPSNFLNIGPEEGGENLPPDAPDIDGPKSCKVSVMYIYTFTSSDPEDNDVFYEIVWGDGTGEEWMGPYTSGETVPVNKTWKMMGEFTIWARAKDSEGLIGEWKQYGVIKVPRNRIFTNTLLIWLMELFPVLSKFLYLIK